MDGRFASGNGQQRLNSQAGAELRQNVAREQIKLAGQRNA
jgi:hypothetical protein